MKTEIILFATSLLATASFAGGPRYSDWSTPVNLGPVINTAFNDQHPALSKDALSLYFTSNRPGGFGADDLWVSQRASADDPWGAPQNLGAIINTGAVEFAPAFSRDGHWLFFHSDRPGGFGGVDIWASYREHMVDDFGWQSPINLGAGVNSPYDDAGPTYFQDDDTGVVTLYFTSLNRPEGLWVSTRETTLDSWTTPVNVGPSVNTTSFDGAPALSSDGETLLFYSNRPGGFGANDLYMSTRQKLRGNGE